MKQKNKARQFVDGITSSNTPRREEQSGTREEGVPYNIRYSLFRILSVFVLVLLSSFGLYSVGKTTSFYSDVEMTMGNYLESTRIGFKVEIASSTEVQVDLGSGMQTVVPVMTPYSGSDPIQYLVKSIVVSGDEAFCNAIQLTSTFPFVYSGNLIPLVTSTSTTYGSWSLDLSVPDPSLFSNNSCKVMLEYTGWHDGIPFGQGYVDVKNITLTIFVPNTSPILPFSVSFTGENSNVGEGSNEESSNTVEDNTENKSDVEDSGNNSDSGEEQNNTSQQTQTDTQNSSESAEDNSGDQNQNPEKGNETEENQTSSVETTNVSSEQTNVVETSSDSNSQ